MSYGAQIKIGIARQSAAGTGATDPGSFHPFGILSEDVGLDAEELISENLNGRFAQGATYSGARNVSGTIEYELTPRNIGAALAAAINHSPTSVSSASIRTRTWLPNTVDFSSSLIKAPFSIYKQWTDANSGEHFYDSQFGQMNLTFAAGAFVKGSITCNGGTRTATGIGSASVFPNAADIGILYPWNVASVSYGGSAVSNFSEISIDVNESIAPLQSLNGSTQPFKFTREGFREVTVNGTFYMTDRSMLNNFVNETQARLVITCINTRTAIQSGYYNTFSVDIPQLKITQFKPGTSGPGEVAVSFTARGIVDPTSDYVIQFTTVDTWQAGY